MHYTRNNTCIHANHVREYQSQLWNNFPAVRTVQDALSEKAVGCQAVYGVILTIEMHIRTRRHRRKNQSTASFPEYIN